MSHLSILCFQIRSIGNIWDNIPIHSFVLLWNIFFQNFATVPCLSSIGDVGMNLQFFLVLVFVWKNNADGDAVDVTPSVVKCCWPKTNLTKDLWWDFWVLTFEAFQTLTETFHKCSPIIITIYKVAIKFQILTSWRKKNWNKYSGFNFMADWNYILGLLSLIIQTYSSIYYHIQKNVF